MCVYIYTHIYIYIHRCGPVQTTHENVRLCVERCRHSWSCRVERLRPSGAERARAAISGAPAQPNRLERPCRAFHRNRAGSTPQASAGAVLFSKNQAKQFRAPWRSRFEFERPCRIPQLAKMKAPSSQMELRGARRPAAEGISLKIKH